MQISLEEITEELIHNTNPSSIDGCSNADRVNFILDVMEVDHLDINQKFDFTGIIECKDISMVEACKHLALLQLEYVNRAHYHGHITTDAMNLQTSILILAIQRINWHLKYLGMDRPTPPFQFIH